MNKGQADPVWELAAVLAAENAALRAADYVAAVALLPAKEAALTRLADGAPAGSDETAHLRDLAVENHTLLERAIAVQTRIVRIVAMASAAPRPQRYERPGQPVPATRADAMVLSAQA